MVFILKVNNIQEKKFEPHCLRAPVPFLINTVKKRGNANADWKQNNANFSDNEKPWLANKR